MPTKKKESREQESVHGHGKKQFGATMSPRIPEKKHPFLKNLSLGEEEQKYGSNGTPARRRKTDGRIPASPTTMTSKASSLFCSFSSFSSFSSSSSSFSSFSSSSSSSSSSSLIVSQKPTSAFPTIVSTNTGAVVAI
eukprot:3449586-Ditylum_brightwellii.AAC.1